MACEIIMNSSENSTVIEAKIRLALADHGQVLTVNDGIEPLLGFKPEDFLSTRVSLHERIHPDDHDIADALFSPEATPDTGSFNIRLRQANGRIRCVKGYFKKETHADGLILDLRLQDAKSLMQSQDGLPMMANFKAMMENTDDYIYFKDRNHVLTGASQTLVSVCDPAEHWTDLIGQTDYDVFPEAYADIYYGLEKQVFAGKPVAHEVQETLTKDGKKGWVDNRKYPIRNDSGEIIGLFGIARDITELKQVETALQKNEQLLNQVGRIAKIGGWEMDLLTRKARWTQGTYDIVEIERGNPIPGPDEHVSFYLPEFRSIVEADMRATIEDDVPLNYEAMLQTAKGHVIWVQARGISVRDNGICIGLQGTLQDITERKHLEAVGEEVSSRLRRIANRLPGVVYQFRLRPDGSSCLPYASEAIQAIYRVSPEEVREDASPIFAILHPDDLDGVVSSIQKSAQDLTPWVHEYRAKFNDGTVHWLLGNAQPDREVDGSTLWHGFITDITDRKQAEAELKQHRHHLEELVQLRTAELMQAEARASHIIQSSADGLYGTDFSGRITFINPAACELLGYTPEQALGHYSHHLFHHSKPDGSPYPIEECPSHRALPFGQNVRIDDEVFWHKEGHPVPVIYAMHPMRQDGKVIGAVTSFVDVSEQRAAAQAREEALIAAERLAHLRSEFLANMSHEIRTPLNGVLGFAEIGARNYQDNDKALNAFNQILGSGKRLLGVINDILDFSKIEAGKLNIEKIDANLVEIVRQAVELSQPRVEAKHLSLLIKLAPDIPRTFLGDPLRIGQVLLNLLTNAVKFTEAGHITLSAALEGSQLVFKVIDTGIGMDAEQLARLFTPFQQADGSTTRKFGGTGLGLAITKRILELMGGEIQVESQPGAGSTFEFRFPYVEATPRAVEPAPVTSTTTERPLAGIAILVAEDEPVNQIVLETNLVEDGARVVVVGNGREAVERVSQDGAKAYDIVLMDVQMPEMDGYEATRRILARVPGLPIIGQTAHAMAEEKAKCLDAGMVDHIAKPIDAKALVKMVLQHVAGGRGR
jgi:PAS domain S-box-containing protein